MQNNNLYNKVFNKENKKNIYLSVGLIVFALCVVGATYAYFALTASNNSVTGTVGGADLNLTVTKVVPTSVTTNMIPQLESTLGEAVADYNCVDENGNVVCHVYKATITNGDKTSAKLTGSISFTYSGTGNLEEKLPNLKWRRMTNVNTLGDNESYQATTSKRVFEEERLFAPEESNEYYFVVWIDEIGDEQPDTGTFRATINFDSADGKGLTSTVVPEPNAPNIDNGNLIPVYYDNSSDKWRKADSTNTNDSWYDYDDKEWANAVLIKDDTTRATYQNIAVNEEVPESVIDAFYVWIPRYKYRVWNITRQAGAESTYAYPAYSNGIDIMWEMGTESTGNVVCEYDVMTEESETNLSDVCVYNGTDTITTTSGNSNYTDAWYTHPAFDFDGVPKTGFWIGKFETTGSEEFPTILPDELVKRNQHIYDKFVTARIFQTYGLSNNVDAHILTSYEWGAVAYLTHSIYGLCDITSCRDIYFNNSSGVYTGRSGGNVYNSDELQLVNFYGSSITTSTDKYNTNGYYNYKGYKLDYDGHITSIKDVNKVGSTTGNVTGVYDMSGGTLEIVMGNMVNSIGGFNPIVMASDWLLDSKYYNSYSYSSSNYYGQIAWNRARLGDATAEASGNYYGYSAWMPGESITGAYSDFIKGNVPWFVRGGMYKNGGSGVFYFRWDDGVNDSTKAFRSSIS